MARDLLRYAAAAAIAAGALALPAGPAAADVVGQLGKRLADYEAEVQKLGSGIRRPEHVGKARTSDLVTRRIIDAQVNFGIGNYNDAAVVLYDVVAKHRRHPSWDEALYYLAESLFQKRDNVGSRTHFAQLVEEVGPKSKFYQQGLERLIELTLRLQDAEGVEKWLALLDQVPESRMRSSVPYVRGKYEFFRQDYPTAIEWLGRVPQGSEYYFQARYLAGASHIAAGDLGRAGSEFSRLVREKPTRVEDRRVVELSHMALGRIFYERDQPSRAIDQYLMISRRSDLFDEVLYEVAWVYVKSGEYRRALRALELLALADPDSARLPDVKILEGNLRIRSAQAAAEEGLGRASEQYEGALAAFEGLRDSYGQPRDELLRVMQEHEDPRVFMAQVTRRHSDSFETHATLPEVVAAWLRQEPDMKRVVGIEDDLGEIADDIAEAELTIERLERALSAPSRVNIFPSLAERRTRSTEILEDLFQIRIQLATHERARVTSHATPEERAQLERLQARRQEVARRLAALPDAEVAYGSRLDRARRQYDQLDQRAAEVSTAIDITRAQIVALQVFLADEGAKELAREDVEAVHAELHKLRAEIDQARRELDQVRREALVARDQAGTGDEVARRADILRDQLRQALDEEHRYLSRIVAKMGGADRAKAEQIGALTGRANAITGRLDRLNETIDAIVEEALVEVRESLTEEKGRLAAYRREFSNYEVESRDLGGEVLGIGFDAVAKKFYEVLLRSDVGVVDVAWSLREAADRLARKLTLDQARERRTLDADFSDVLDEVRAQQQQEFEQQGGER
jgi:tetratricopeptide (TPR) repeat protein